MKFLSATALAAPCLAFAACTALVDLGGPNGGVVDGGTGTGAEGSAPDAGEGGIACDPQTTDCLCTPAQRDVRWAQMIIDPIIPPYKYAGLDLRKDDTWAGLTLEEAEKINCKATIDSPGTAYWGANKEVVFLYDLETHVVQQTIQGPGDHSKMSFKDRTGVNSYVIQIGGGITRNGAPFVIDWTAPDAQLTELYNAALSPNGFPQDPAFTDSANCRKDRGCLIIPDDGTGIAYFGIRPLAAYFNFHRLNQPPATAGIPFQLYNFYMKTLPYSSAPVTLKLDAVGPTISTVTTPSGPCDLRLGGTYADLVKSCLRVTGTPARDDENVKKFLGGRKHDLESFVENARGLNPVIAHISGNLSVLGDSDVPSDQDPIVGFAIAPVATGLVRNDLAATGLPDGHGTGLVYREWARLVQEDLSAAFPAAQRHALGAAECLGASPATGCTGFEGFVFPGLVFPGDPPDLQKLVDPAAAGVSALSGAGDVRFCSDPGTFANCDPGDNWPSAVLARVVKVLGKGQITSLPADAQDTRYYFRTYVLALMKYLKAYGASPNLVPADVAAASIDRESLLFGVGSYASFDRVSYVERASMTAANPSPLVVDLTEELPSGTQQRTNWTHLMERAETALFSAMLTNKTSLPGVENNVNLTNLFGSPALAAAYESAYCATTIDVALCTHSQPPPQDTPGVLTKDLNGTKPLLSYYAGAFGKTVLARGKSPIKIISTDPGGAPAGKPPIAIIEIPNLRDPYSPPGGANTSVPIQTVVPWLAAGALSIPTGATTDKQVAASQITFQGAFGNYVVNYAMYVDPATHQPTGEIIVQAIETTSFPGEVFLCRDTATGDLLRARGYTSAQTMLDWITAHPSATAACDLVVRMRQGNAGVDFIASRKNGVKASMSQGDGAGRVLRALLYDPAL